MTTEWLTPWLGGVFEAVTKIYVGTTIYNSEQVSAELLSEAITFSNAMCNSSASSS
jgi:hypothetical protein